MSRNSFTVKMAANKYTYMMQQAVQLLLKDEVIAMFQHQKLGRWWADLGGRKETTFHGPRKPFSMVTRAQKVTAEKN